MKRVELYIGLGANLGAATDTIHRAAAQLARHPGLADVQMSPLYRTAPIDSSGPDYINAVAQATTLLSPQEVLRLLQAIERVFGRERPYRNAPRTLDLDLLLYGDCQLNSPELTLPHPRMAERAFVLRPLADLRPGLALPQGRLDALLVACADQAIERLDPA
ncbi:MAG TPA: 2-amino-4-hydroxy-6-hydroxymethyldihydropteridine diphosphokinase [Castellaniella sp.]|nr:2-amino-4-hydroxy-6-hydroxymethyldihydropteridine diphosphokinase [Castellaniella sp.]